MDLPSHVRSSRALPAWRAAPAPARLVLQTEFHCIQHTLFLPELNPTGGILNNIPGPSPAQSDHSQELELERGWRGGERHLPDAVRLRTGALRPRGQSQRKPGFGSSVVIKRHQSFLTSPGMVCDQPGGPDLQPRRFIMSPAGHVPSLVGSLALRDDLKGPDKTR